MISTSLKKIVHTSSSITYSAEVWIKAGTTFPAPIHSINKMRPGSFEVDT